jgi:hypothetical protein
MERFVIRQNIERYREMLKITLVSSRYRVIRRFERYQMSDHNDPEKPFYFGEVIGSSMSYHQPNCHIVRQIYSRNYKRLRNWQEAVDLGLNPCPHCRPPFISPPKAPPKASQRSTADLVFSPSQLSDLRRGVLRLLDGLESHQKSVEETVAARIQRLARAKVVPYTVASCMHTIRTMRNDKEYSAKTISQAETQAVAGALSVIKDWAKESGLTLPDELNKVFPLE